MVSRIFLSKGSNHVIAENLPLGLNCEAKCTVVTIIAITFPAWLQQR